MQQLRQYFLLMSEYDQKNMYNSVYGCWFLLQEINLNCYFVYRWVNGMILWSLLLVWRWELINLVLLYLTLSLPKSNSYFSLLSGIQFLWCYFRESDIQLIDDSFMVFFFICITCLLINNVYNLVRRHSVLVSFWS